MLVVVQVLSCNKKETKYYQADFPFKKCTHTCSLSQTNYSSAAMESELCWQSSRGAAYHNGENMFQAVFIFRNFACFIILMSIYCRQKTNAPELAVPSHSIQTQFFTLLNIHIGKSPI
jgi:hypothetical protein